MKTALTNGIILDGSEQMQPIMGKTVLIDGDRIADIIDGNDIPEGYTVFDLQGGYLMPGLINLHVHLPASGKPKKKPTDPKKLVKLVLSTRLTRKYIEAVCASAAKTQLYSGVTTIRTVGGVESYDTKLRDEIAAGKRDGARIYAANMAVSVPGGHMAGSLAYAAESAEEARNDVTKIAADKPDLIKLMVTGGVLDAKKRGEPGELKMPPEYVAAACEEAHRLGLPVAAHTESAEGVKAALRGGVDTIEHGAAPDEEMLALFRERGAKLVATLSPAMPYAVFDYADSYCDETAHENGDIVFRGIIECAKACLAAGIPVGLGTDTGCPYVTHYGMWRELSYFQKYCGVTPAFALYTATKRNAEILGASDLFGTVEKGKYADLIVTRENPLEDLTALRGTETVIKEGKFYTDVGAKLKKMKKVEETLDRYAAL